MSAQSNQHNQTEHHVGLKSRFRLRHRRDDSSAALKRSRSSRGNRGRDSEQPPALGELQSNANCNDVLNEATHPPQQPSTTEQHTEPQRCSVAEQKAEKPNEPQLAASHTHTHTQSQECLRSVVTQRLDDVTAHVT